MKLAKIGEALTDFERGEKVIFVRDDTGPQEGYLAAAAEKVTPLCLEFMSAHGTGFLGLALTSERMEALGIPQAPVDWSDAPFSEAVHLPSTNGSSAIGSQADVVRTFADPSVRSGLRKLPRQIVPLRAMRGGVLACATPVEAVVDLAWLSGLAAAGLVCRLSEVSGNGACSPAGPAEFAERHGLKVISIPELIAHRRANAGARLVSLPEPVRLPTRHGDFHAQVFEDPLTGVHHMAMVMGNVDDGRPALTRLHSECLTGDVLGSLRCDCGPQLEAALEQIAAAGRGVLLYLRQEGRGIGLYNKLRTYALQERGLDTVEANEQLGFPADLRDFGIASQMLVELGVSEVRLLTNNPKKIEGLENCGVRVRERVPLEVSASEENLFYLRTKRKKMGHMLIQETVSATDDEP